MLLIIKEFISGIDVIKTLNIKSIILILFAIILYFISVLVYALRWKIVLKNMGVEISLLEILKITISAIFVNNITPLSRSGGEALRIAWVSKKYKIPLTITTVSIVYERLSEIIPVILLSIIAFTYFGNIAIYPIIFLSLFVIIIYSKWESFIKFFIKLFKINLSIEEEKNILSLKNKKLMYLIIVCLSSIVWSLDIFRLKLIATAFGWNIGLTFLAVISFTNLLLGFISITPGGIGIIEGGLIGTLLYFGIPIVYAMPFVITERLISYVISSGIGFIVLITSGSKDIWKATKSH